MKHARVEHDCGGTVEYSERYDAYFCTKCRTWIEGRCRDPECYYCKDRPEKSPADAKA